MADKIDTGILGNRNEKDLCINLNGVICYTRAVGLIIKDGKLLLMVKSTDYDCYYTVGGGIRINESSAEAVKREVFEETGCKLEIDRIVFIGERFLTLKGEKYHEICFYYLMKNTEDMNITESSTTDLSKETLHWLPLDGLKDLYIVPPFLKERNLKELVRTEYIIS